MTTAAEEKYQVYPNEWPEGETDPIGDSLEAGTYFVLKSSDPFAAAALWGYAHLVQSHVELSRVRGTFTEEETKRLEELCDLVTTKAEDWQKAGAERPTWKIPD